jgi:hypothetical protein
MSARELISFGNLQKVLEEVLKQQRDMSATVQYLKATVEAHCSKEYVDEKLRGVCEQIAQQDQTLAQLRTDMFDVSNVAAELPRLADSQAAGLVAIEQRLTLSIGSQLSELKQRAVDMEIGLSERATTNEARKMRIELDDRPRREELKHLIESTNKLRDSFGNRLDDLTERMWGMRNEGASKLSESTNVLGSKVEGTAAQLASLEKQQRSITSLLSKLEKDTLAKVSYSEVGSLKKELFAQLHDVHALLTADLAADRAKLSRTEAELAQTNLALEQRATLKMLSATDARVDTHDTLLALAQHAIAERALAADLLAEVAAREDATRELRALVQTKVHSEGQTKRVRSGVQGLRGEFGAGCTRTALDTALDTCGPVRPCAGGTAGDG